MTSRISGQIGEEGSGNRRADSTQAVPETCSQLRRPWCVGSDGECFPEALLWGGTGLPSTWSSLPRTGWVHGGTRICHPSRSARLGVGEGGRRGQKEQASTVRGGTPSDSGPGFPEPGRKTSREGQCGRRESWQALASASWAAVAPSSICWAFPLNQDGGFQGKSKQPSGSLRGCAPVWPHRSGLSIP